MAYFPAKHWDSQADEWDATVANKNFPHYFYYYEADLYVADLLETSRLALELGAGTCGSTVKHASKDRRIVATDYSRKMLEAGKNKLRTAGLADFVDIVGGRRLQSTISRPLFRQIIQPRSCTLLCQKPRQVCPRNLEGIGEKRPSRHRLYEQNLG